MSCSPKEVKALSGSKLQSSQIQPFVDQAKCLIDMAAECVTVTQSCQDMACVNLAVHYLQASNVGSALRRIKRQRIENVYEATYATGADSGKGIMSSTWGQTANQLMKGSLVKFDQQPVSLSSLGTIGDAC